MDFCFSLGKNSPLGGGAGFFFVSLDFPSQCLRSLDSPFVTSCSVGVICFNFASTTKRADSTKFAKGRFSLSSS